MSELEKPFDPGLRQVLQRLGIRTDALLGQGGESWVFALDSGRIARINRTGASMDKVSGRNELLSELGRSAENVPFLIPVILDIDLIEGHHVTFERRLPGRPLGQVLGEAVGGARDLILHAYLEAAARIGDLVVQRPWFGELIGSNAIRTSSHQEYLRKRIGRSLLAAGPEFAAVDPAPLASALPDPDRPSLVHLDAFPGNMLAEGTEVTAVLDFGTSCFIGDRRLDPVTAAVYLDPSITPVATDKDRAVAQEWMIARELSDLYEPVRNWLAAYWSFATNDITLYRWCKSILTG